MRLSRKRQRDASPSGTFSRLPRARRVSDAREAIEKQPPEAVEFSVKRFFHSLWQLPLSAQPSESTPSEDLLFAFLEKVCSIIEIELENDAGERCFIFPSKLNHYLTLPGVEKAGLAPVPSSIDSGTPVSPCREGAPHNNREGFVSDTSATQISPASIPENRLDRELLFNVSVQELRFAFASAKNESSVITEDQAPTTSLSAALIRVASDDSD
jgi:hypothetical protein